MDWKKDKLYQEYLKAGYKEWESKAQEKLKGTPYFLQKGFREDNSILYFITIFVFVDEENNVLFQPEINLNTKTGICFEIIVMEDRITPENLENFCTKVYSGLDCRIYGKKDA